MRAVTYLLKEYLFIEGVALSSDLVTFDGKLKYIRENYVSTINKKAKFEMQFDDF